MEPEPEGPYPGGDDEVSRQREKHTTALLARFVPGSPRPAFDAMTRSGTVVELPVRRRSCAAGAAKFGCEPTGARKRDERALYSAWRLRALQQLQAMLPPD